MKLNFIPIMPLACVAALVGFSTLGIAKPPQKQDKSVHHAAMHAEHWLNHHVSAPHGKAYQHRVAKRNHNARKAIKHAEHWINHHVSAPHRNTGG